MMTFAGELADSQMEKFMEFSKKEKYEDAVSALLDAVLLLSNQPDVKKTEMIAYAGYVKRFFATHGKPLNHTKWRKRSLSKNWDETVYQINCEYSAWMIEIREYVNSEGVHSFGEFRFVTEDDIFKVYGK